MEALIVIGVIVSVYAAYGLVRSLCYMLLFQARKKRLEKGLSEIERLLAKARHLESMENYVRQNGHEYVAGCRKAEKEYVTEYVYKLRAECVDDLRDMKEVYERWKKSTFTLFEK